MKSGISIILVSVLFLQCAKTPVVKVAAVPVAEDKSWRNSAPQPAAARDISLGSYSAFDLENGLKVIVVENHKLPRISYQLSLNNEALIEGEKAGYTAMAGEMLSTGTSTKTKAQLDEAIDFIGASISTSATGVFGSSLKKHSGKLLDLMTDVLYNPSFPKDEFEKLKKRTLSGLASAKTNPEAIAASIRSTVNYNKNHPYGEVQTEETVKAITLEDCKGYYQSYFKPNNAYLVIVGDITPDEARSQVQQYFSSWRSGAVSEQEYPLPDSPVGSQVRFGNKDGAVQSVINISYPVVLTPGSEDAITASVMNTILGGGIFSGRLMQNLREKRAYTYGARSTLSPDRLTGNFNAFASVRNEVTDSAVTEFLFEMNRIVDESVTEADLALAKSSMAGNFGRSLESPQTIAGFALNTFRYQLPRDYYNNYLKNLEAVTVDDIRQMAKKYIRPSNCNIVVVGNKENVAEKLVRFDSDGVIDYYDPFGRKLEDKKIEVSDKVTAATVINDYIEAIGGKAALTGVNSLYIGMKTTMMDREAMLETWKLNPGKLTTKMSMGPMVLQEQRFDGVKAVQSQMGKKEIVTDTAELAKLRLQAAMFEQLNYLTGPYAISLEGIDQVEGKECYKIKVTSPDQSVSYEFYDVKTSLLVRSVSRQGEGERQLTLTTDFSDYKDVNGILFPYSTSIIGAMPVPLVLEAIKIGVNEVISDDVFKVD